MTAYKTDLDEQFELFILEKADKKWILENRTSLIEAGLKFNEAKLICY